MRVMGVDPGLTTGIAIWDTELQTFTLATEVRAEHKNLHASPMALWLERNDDIADIIVIENYVQRPNFMVQSKVKSAGTIAPHTFWTEQTTAKIIGMFHYYATLEDINVVEQEPAVKPIGYGVAKMRYTPGKKGMHITDAMAHARFYVHQLEGRVRNESTDSSK
jgi:hypothetical protein